MKRVSSITKLTSLGACVCMLASTPLQGFSQTPAAGGGTVTFGVTPFLDVEVMKREFAPIIDYIGKRAGVETRIVFPYDYLLATEDMRDGYVDFAWLTPTAYVIAKKKVADLRIVAQLTENGRSHYEGYLIARRDSGVRSLEDLKGKSFGFVDTSSASGYVYPRAMMIERGINPATFFSKIIFLGDHTRVIDAVYAGDVSAGATYDAAFAAAAKRGIDTGTLTIFARTPPIPQDAICSRPGMNGKVVKDIAAALFGINTPGGEHFALKGYGTIGFRPARDSDYDAVRRAMAVQ